MPPVETAVVAVALVQTAGVAEAPVYIVVVAASV